MQTKMNANRPRHRSTRATRKAAPTPRIVNQPVEQDLLVSAHEESHSPIQDKFSVAVVGLSGAGKTILTAVLAKRFEVAANHVYFLDPEDRDTGIHVETIWDTMHNKGDWPDLTVNGTYVDLRWKLHSRDRGFLCDFRAIDCSGQDLGMIFGSENAKPGESTGGYFEMLRAYCLNADIVIYTLNLEDALGQGDQLRKVTNDLTIRAILKHVGPGSLVGGKSMCIALTQVDKFRELARMYGGWDEVIARSFPHTFGQLAKRSDVPVFPVSAVANTRIVSDDQGVPHRVPAQQFESEGLNDLIEWIASRVESAIDAQSNEIIRNEKAAREAEDARRYQENNKTFAIICLKIGVCIVAAVLVNTLVGMLIGSKVEGNKRVEGFIYLVGLLGGAGWAVGPMILKKLRSR